MACNIRMNNKELQSIFEKNGFKTISMKDSLEGIEPIDFSEEILRGERKVSFSKLASKGIQFRNIIENL